MGVQLQLIVGVRNSAFHWGVGGKPAFFLEIAISPPVYTPALIWQSIYGFVHRCSVSALFTNEKGL
jgi:hypothetical protein